MKKQAVKKRKKFSRLSLFYWLGISLLSLMLLTSPAAHASSQTSRLDLTAGNGSQSAGTGQARNLPADPCGANHGGDCGMNKVCEQDLTAQNCKPFVTPGDIKATNANPNDGLGIQTPNLPDKSWLLNPFTTPILLFTSAEQTYGHLSITTFWQGGVAIVDALLVLVVLVNGLMILFGASVFRHADLAETIPRLLLALIVAHVSLLLIGVVVSFANGMSVGLFNWASANSDAQAVYTAHPGTSDDMQKSVKIIKQLVFISAFTDPFGPNAPKIDVNIGDVMNHSDQIFDFMFELGLAVLNLGLFMQLVLRIFFINLYTIISAPCIACWALPGQSGQPVTRFWFHGFISVVMAQVLQVVALIVVQIITAQVLAEVLIANNFDAHQFVGIVNSQFSAINGWSWDFNVIHGSFDGSTDHDLRVILSSVDSFKPFWHLYECLQIAALFFVMRIPGIIQSSSTQTMIAGGQAMSQAMGSAMSSSIGTSQAMLMGVMSLVSSGVGLGIAAA